MATMHPKDIGGFEDATEGEKRVFRFIRQAAQPDRDNICWYQPDIAGFRPDFILFNRTLGLVVIEVKDWMINQIVAGDPQEVILRLGSNEKRLRNPRVQAKAYVDKLREALSSQHAFRVRDGLYQGKLAIPIAALVVFPNISRDEYERAGLQRWLRPEHVLLEDDLGPHSEFIWDDSRFQRRLADIGFVFPFQGLDERAVERLHAVIWPEVRIDLPQRQGESKQQFQEEVQALDQNQARVARRLRRGYLLLKGPAGSGKTVVLVHRSCLLHKYDKRVRKILVVCYNIAFARYLKRLFQEKGMPLGVEGVQVCHFFELVAQILEDKVEYDNRDNDYYDYLVMDAAEQVKSGRHSLGLMDAVFVDEGQDLDDQKIQLLWELVKPGGDFCVALDPYQDLYRKAHPLKAMGITARGRVQTLKRSYRNTEEILEFGRRFIERSAGSMDQPRLPFDDLRHGPAPAMPRFGNLEELEAFLVEDIQAHVRRKDYKRSEIAVVYDDKIYEAAEFSYNERTLPRSILKRLESAAIPTKWVSEDVRSKELFDITSDAVSLISIHSAKGLDFDLVYLVGMDRIPVKPSTQPRIQRLLYVAISRAKHQLIIPYVQETELIKRMIGCCHA